MVGQIIFIFYWKLGRLELSVNFLYFKIFGVVKKGELVFGFLNCEQVTFGPLEFIFCESVIRTNSPTKKDDWSTKKRSKFRISIGGYLITHWSIIPWWGTVSSKYCYWWTRDRYHTSTITILSNSFTFKLIHFG